MKHSSPSSLDLSLSCPPVTGSYSTWRMGVAVSFPFTAPSLCGPSGKDRGEKNARGMRTTSVMKVGCYPMAKARGCNWWRWTRLLPLLGFYELHRPSPWGDRERRSDRCSDIDATVLARVQWVWRVTRGQKGEIFSQGPSRNKRATFHPPISAVLFFSLVILDVGHGGNAERLVCMRRPFHRDHVKKDAGLNA